MENMAIRFPKDSLKHEAAIEWWYFNGNLQDAKGRKYAFMDCLFKANPKKAGISFLEKIPLKRIYFSHSLLSDVSKNKTVSRIHPLSIISRDSFSKKLLFVDYIHPSLGGYVNYEINEAKPFCYRIKTEDFDLMLKARKKPLLHNGKGVFVFAGKAELSGMTETQSVSHHDKKPVYYYSLTDLDAKGTINLNGKEISVKGKAWMDHEWANEAGEKKWNWFSVQLDSGEEMMIQEYKDKYRYAGIAHKNGKVEFASDLILIPKEEWKSKKTGASYPVEWKILVPSRKIELETKALARHELLFGDINYFEVPVEVSGKVNGKNVKGKGFMELVGRRMSKSAVEVYGKEIKKEVEKYWEWGKEKAVSYLKERLAHYF